VGLRVQAYLETGQPVVVIERGAGLDFAFDDSPLQQEPSYGLGEARRDAQGFARSFKARRQAKAGSFPPFTESYVVSGLNDQLQRFVIGSPEKYWMQAVHGASPANRKNEDLKSTSHCRHVGIHERSVTSNHSREVVN
jgi:hypothetical protein